MASPDDADAEILRRALEDVAEPEPRAGWQAIAWAVLVVVGAFMLLVAAFLFVAWIEQLAQSGQ